MAICAGCRTYRRQVNALGQLIDRKFHSWDTAPLNEKLSDESRERIAGALTDASGGKNTGQ